MCLIARHFESRGLPTFILGSALDILEAGRPPRAAFLDYPLGFEAGRPFNPGNQRAILEAALEALAALRSPAIVKLPFEWPAGWDMIERRETASAGRDFRSPRDTTPRYQTEEDRRLAEGPENG